MHYKEFLGALSVAIGIVAYIPYFRDIFRGHTKPHLFSWLSWAIGESIIFIIQVLNHAGPGAWISGLTALLCFTVTFLAFTKGDRKFSMLDWISFLGSLLALLLWWLTKNPLSAVILLILSDAAAFSITFRKTYFKPHEETLVEYALAGLKSLVAIFAVQNFSVTNWLFLAYLVLANGSFTLLGLWRRRQLKLNK